ncbi:MAG: hypothetical protein MJ149_02600, partial [Clostridia bacterium]|nr:hypothetical protein [Clostridia bacterium]
TIGGEVEVGEDKVYFGKFTGEYVGLIIGGDYSLQNMKDYKHGYGAFDASVKTENIIPNELSAERVKNCKINKGTIDYSVSMMSTYYDFVDTGDYTTYELSKLKVFGWIIGLTIDYVDNPEDSSIKNYQFAIEKDTNGNFNLSCWDVDAEKHNLTNVKLNNFKDTEQQDVTYDIEDVYVIEQYSSETGLSILTYLVGARAASIDSWSRTAYAESALLVLFNGALN